MKYTYVGIDSHKDTHTAVLLDYFFEKLGEIVFDNLPSAYGKFLSDADKLKMDGTTLLFGLEDVSVYGRALTVFLKNNGQAVKHVNAYLVAQERGRQATTQKDDSIDAKCAAHVLLSEFSTLPDADPKDDYWALRTLVIRRAAIVRNNGALKNSLHNLLTHHYPGYTSFFESIERKTSLAFFMQYPSPSTLAGVTLEELTKFLREPSNGRTGRAKAQEILDSLQETTNEFQKIRDMSVQSIIRQLQFNLEELEHLEVALADLLISFNCTLMSMTGIDVVSASQLLSCIGDVKRFSTPAKLARYSGIAPITYASGKKDTQFRNQRGNRELNSLFYNLALRVTMTVGSTNKAVNPFFYEYYHKKMSEGKTKAQALKCVQRRLVNIIWRMLTNHEEYINPPMYDVPKKPKETKKAACH
jgi:transposase